MEQLIISNKRAENLYFVNYTMECGIVLKGTEVKSVRARKVNFKDSFAGFEDGELYLFNLHISPYEKESHFNHDPTRKRKLLLHKRELIRLYSKVQEKGYTLIPLSLYFNEKNKVKIELAVCHGKRKYDKRKDLIQKRQKKEIERTLKHDF